jgi:hypothetical protein
MHISSLGSTKGLFNVIRFQPDEINKLDIYRQFQFNIIKVMNKQDPTNELLEEIVNDWISVFQKEKINTSSYIGLFGELLLIRYMFINYKVNIYECYQKEDNDAIDFNCKNMKFDCKTTTSSFISFSLTRRQLDLKHSIVHLRLYRNSSTGMTLLELIDDLMIRNIITESKLKNDIEKKYKNYIYKYDVDDVNIRVIPSDIFSMLSFKGFDTINADIKVSFTFKEEDTKDESYILYNLKGDKHGK